MSGHKTDCLRALFFLFVCFSKWGKFYYFNLDTKYKLSLPQTY